MPAPIRTESLLASGTGTLRVHFERSMENKACKIKSQYAETFSKKFDGHVIDSFQDIVKRPNHRPRVAVCAFYGCAWQ